MRDAIKPACLQHRHAIVKARKLGTLAPLRKEAIRKLADQRLVSRGVLGKDYPEHETRTPAPSAPFAYPCG